MLCVSLVADLSSKGRWRSDKLVGFLEYVMRAFRSLVRMSVRNEPWVFPILYMHF